MKAALYRSIISLMIAMCLDVLSTTIGLLIGLKELSPWFLLFPGGWVLLDIALVCMIFYFPAALRKMKTHLILIIVVAAFLPFVNNVLHIGFKLGAALF